MSIKSIVYIEIAREVRPRNAFGPRSRPPAESPGAGGSLRPAPTAHWPGRLTGPPAPPPAGHSLDRRPRRSPFTRVSPARRSAADAAQASVARRAPRRPPPPDLRPGLPRLRLGRPDRGAAAALLRPRLEHDRRDRNGGVRQRHVRRRHRASRRVHQQEDHRRPAGRGHAERRQARRHARHRPRQARRGPELGPGGRAWRGAVYSYNESAPTSTRSPPSPTATPPTSPGCLSSPAGSPRRARRP